ncbi:hypothetical protein TL16_g12754 [Triparma laevis f. inornata]|uniref:Sulfate transporter n=1 Tax=Triparma laevis f. inornata TaxID=1714386 RepID=A0A9W7EV85_9STRA|nr:hypothetical protein TL16_g12754 [Triparma laevis f. inornata]
MKRTTSLESHHITISESTPLMNNKTTSQLQPSKPKSNSFLNSLTSPTLTSLIYGLINSLMCIPCLYGYASIIYRHSFYTPYLPLLSKLLILSSVIHQLSFTIFSTLPFSIGQVQDAGLLFLSRITTIIVTTLLKTNATDSKIITTTIFLISTCTFITGLSLILFAKLKLSRFVAYVPIPVVGGYLGFIGYFCLQAGVALCISKPMSMIIVVAFSSVLDVTAISIDIGQGLEADKELETVGISNALSGLTGGFTGSYIFSQTIFQYRTRDWSRWVGIIVALSETIVFLMDQDVLSFSPLFFFGATLIFIGLDLLIEWLYEIREKLLPQEYLILLSTFGAIQIVGIDAGVLVGVILSIIDHAATTSNQDSKHHVRKIERRSRKVRSLESWKSVQAIAYNGQVVTFELRGVLYFGNSIQLLRMLFESIGIDSQKAFDFKELMKSPGRATPQGPPKPPRHLGKAHSARQRRGSGSRKIFPRFIVLDYHNVQTVDASAAKTFRQFVDTANKNDVIVCSAGFTPRVERFLRASNVMAERTPTSALPPIVSESSRKLLCFKSVSKALEFCEEQLINSNHPSSSLTPLSPAAAHVRNASLNSVSPAKPDEPYPLLTLINVLLGNSSSRSSPSQTSTDPSAVIFNKYHDIVQLLDGEYLFQQQSTNDDDDIVSVESFGVEDSDTFFFLLEGQVTSYITGEKYTHLERGSVIGYVDFLLSRPRSFNAVVEGGATLAKLTRGQMNWLAVEQPELYVKVERCVLRSSVLELANHDEC